MPDNLQTEQKDFMIEKIKERPVNKKKLLRQTIITAAMALLFGLIACFSFLVLRPVISDWLYPEEDPQIILFPEVDEEMSPEEMLSDTIQDLQKNQNLGEQDVAHMPLSQEQIQKLLSFVELDINNYRELYEAKQEYVERLNKSLVTVKCINSDVDWLDNVMESSQQTCGVIIANTGKELLILTDYESIRDTQLLMVAFYNDLQMQADIGQWDEVTGLAVLSVDTQGLTQQYQEEFVIVSLGSSNTRKTVGMPVIALGSPMGSCGSVGYGIITNETQWSTVDNRYKILQTDIYGSREARGFLFNLQGQLLGVITMDRSEGELEEMIRAYGMSDLRRIVEKMSNAQPVAYLGITGMDVSEEANLMQEVPFGAFVTEVAMDSPAMKAGIQQGDIIVQIKDQPILNYSEYITNLNIAMPEEIINIKVVWKVQDEYKEMTLTITLGELGKEE